MILIPTWSLIALGEGCNACRAYLGAAQSLDHCGAGLSELLDSFKMSDQEKRLLVLHDGDEALSHLSIVLTEAKRQYCIWHQLHNVDIRVRELHLNDHKKIKEMVEVVQGSYV